MNEDELLVQYPLFSNAEAVEFIVKSIQGGEFDELFEIDPVHKMEVITGLGEIIKYLEGDNVEFDLNKADAGWDFILALVDVLVITGKASRYFVFKSPGRTFKMENLLQSGIEYYDFVERLLTSRKN